MESQKVSIGNENLLSPEQMADVLGVKMSWVYRHTMRKGPGSIPRIKVGKYLRFEKEAVLKWVHENQRED